MRIRARVLSLVVLTKVKKTVRSVIESLIVVSPGLYFFRKLGWVSEMHCTFPH
jgi:hypothetical protein